MGPAPQEASQILPPLFPIAVPPRGGRVLKHPACCGDRDRRQRPAIGQLQLRDRGVDGGAGLGGAGLGRAGRGEAGGLAVVTRR